MAKKMKKNVKENNVAVKYEIDIRPPYSKLNSLYISQKVMNEGLLFPGPVEVSVKNNKDYSAEGNLNKRNGILSGMSNLYAELGLKDGDKIGYKILGKNRIEIDAAGKRKPKVKKSDSEYESVSKRKNLKHIYIPVFEPENLKDWNPQTEVDVFMAFGVLQDYTDFRYCSATSKALLDELGYKSTDASSKTGKAAKPDAILIHRVTNEYLVAEFKMRSSLFTSNHGVDDIDVLVVWDDDMEDKANLPSYIVCLKDIAKVAASDNLE